jgi:hypothetical protein
MECMGFDITHVYGLTETYGPASVCAKHEQWGSMLSLAFLAPQLVKAAVEGRLPRAINIERLRDPDPNWSRSSESSASIRTNRAAALPSTFGTFESCSRD